MAAVLTLSGSMTRNQFRAHNRDYAALMAGAWECMEALKPIADRDDGSELCVLAEALFFHARLYASLFEGEAYPEGYTVARRKLARLKAVAHRDCVYRVVLALRTFNVVLDAVYARHACCEGCPACWDAGAVSHAIRAFAVLWDAAADGELSKEAEQREVRRLASRAGKREAAARLALPGRKFGPRTVLAASRPGGRPIGPARLVSR